MVNKKIQKKRMKSYFIEAGYEILKEKGVEHLTVRNIAKRAGYSYGTIYNYFNDVEELMWSIGLKVLKELNRILEEYYNKIKQDKKCSELLRLTYIKYIDYYLENENIYQFIFFEQLDVTNYNTQVGKPEPMLFDLQQEIMQNCVEEGLITKNEKKISGELLTNSINGLLSLYFSGKENINKDDLYSRTKKYIEYILSN
ncbi:MAG: TetR/AcrR family transcriptional regulator [Halanaerobiales bacterium]|nr:TetR/AcrR family transcriptional regulator [Halanaerobiales bacterium]